MHVDKMKRAAQYKLGMRCEHVTRGPGLIVKVTSQDKREVLFDNGEVHLYDPASLHKLKLLSQDEATRTKPFKVPSSRPTIIYYSLEDNPGVASVVDEIEQHVAGIAKRQVATKARSFTLVREITSNISSSLRARKHC